VSIPVIGMGGIASGADAAEFMAAGAAAIAVGTESFRDPGAGHRIGDELAGARGVTSGVTSSVQPSPDHRSGGAPAA
jgi:dihydroorotate dehydrogenase